MSPTHRIRRQRWQVAAASPADAFAVRSALRREHELSLLPALESAFAALDDGEREIHLPRLEITLRVSSPDKLAEELPARLAEELPARLAEAARQALGEALAAPPDRRPAPARDLSPAGRLRRYLLSGQLDWFDAGRDPGEVRRLLAAEAGQWSAVPAAVWPRLLAELPAGGPARGDAFFRFLQLLDDAGRRAWWDFALRLAEASGGDCTPPLLALEQLQAGRPADHALRLQALGLWLLATDPRSSSSRQAEWAGAMQAVAGQLGAIATVEPKKWQILTAWLGGNVALSAGNLSTGGAGPALSPAPGEPGNAPDLPLAGDPAPGLALCSAGLVLLHPYLPRLFSALGWVAADHRPGEPFPSAALPRAAALLHWLATGRDEPCEFELGTAKLLLGLRPADPLPVAGGLLGAAEREEGTALLAAVVEHWSALGKTSLAGLRVAFLQRGGLLYPAADGWLLRPQAETYDLLLDRLPWGISIVRLPWMQRSLHTEWPSP